MSRACSERGPNRIEFVTIYEGKPSASDKLRRKLDEMARRKAASVPCPA
jgi:hypothetical protein